MKDLQKTEGAAFLPCPEEPAVCTLACGIIPWQADLQRCATGVTSSSQHCKLVPRRDGITPQVTGTIGK